MSAATMLACAADKIVMGKHSYLGPIDSQIILSTPLGVSSIPAQAILDQFDKASAECKEDSKNMGVWMPILGQYGPALLIQCQNALDLSKDLVATFLNDYMFKDSENKDEISKDIAEKLADHSTYKSHGRHIDRDQAEALGLIIEHLEDDQTFQDLVLSLFHATTHTFDGTTAIKIIENHKGKAYIKQVTPIIIQQQEKEEKKKK
jgi:ClpP class serine protease